MNGSEVAKGRKLPLVLNASCVSLELTILMIICKSRL